VQLKFIIINLGLNARKSPMAISPYVEFSRLHSSIDLTLVCRRSPISSAGMRNPAPVCAGLLEKSSVATIGQMIDVGRLIAMGGNRQRNKPVVSLLEFSI